MKYCHQCGNQLLDEAVICPNCGVPTETATLSAQNKKTIAIKVNKRLCIVQVVLLIIGAILPFIEGIVTWHVWTLYPWPENISSKGMSMDNLMNTQMEGFASLLFWMFYVVLALTAIYIVLDIFEAFNKNGILGQIGRHKTMIALPTLNVVLYIIMMIVANAHTTDFVWQGQPRNAGVSLGILAYIQLLLLVATTAIEVYKQVFVKQK